MKKVFLSLALVVALSVSFVSCKDTKTEETTVETTEEVVPVEEVTPDAAPAVDTVAVQTTTETTTEVAK